MITSTSVICRAWVETRRRFRRETVVVKLTLVVDVVEKLKSKQINMASFREIREMLLLNHESFSDVEFLLLWNQFESKNPDFPYERYPRFNLENMDESECLAEFKFAMQDITFPADVLQLPDVFTCYQKAVSTRTEGHCILLKLLAYPYK